MGRSHSVLSALLWVQLLFVSSCPFVQAAAPKFVAPQTFRGINHFPTHTLVRGNLALYTRVALGRVKRTAMKPGHVQHGCDIGSTDAGREVSLDRCADELFLCKHHSQIACHLCVLKLKSDCAVYIKQTETELTIIDLSDQKQGSVVASVDGNDVILHPGEEVTMGVDHEPEVFFPESNPLHYTFNLGVRHVEEIAGEVCLVDLLQEKLKGIRVDSFATRFERQEFKRMLKTAVCLAIVKGQRSEPVF